MRLPRDISGDDLIKRLARLGYRISRQTGSHIRLTCDHPAAHHVTIPKHSPLRVGTLAAVLRDVARHQHLDRGELLQKLFD